MRISSLNVIYEMSKDHEPVLTCQSGDTVIFETCDCFHDTVKSEADLVSGIDFNRVNPATGPLYIEGAKAGDLLKVDILSIKIDSFGAVVASPGLGRLEKYIAKEQTVIGEIDGDVVKVLGREVPVNKMVGVIGTAPAGDPVPTGVPHDHGGNMDCAVIAEGASLYLPVNTPGALLSMGDLHACMADGEVMGSGLEIAGEVEVRVEVIKDKKLPTPFVETQDKYITLASRPTMEEASDLAILNMANLLVEKTDLNFEEAGMLLSLAGNLRVCQVVDPNMTMRMEVEKKYF